MRPDPGTTPAPRGRTTPWWCRRQHIALHTRSRGRERLPAHDRRRRDSELGPPLARIARRHQRRQHHHPRPHQVRRGSPLRQGDPPPGPQRPEVRHPPREDHRVRSVRPVLRADRRGPDRHRHRHPHRRHLHPHILRADHRRNPLQRDRRPGEGRPGSTVEHRPRRRHRHRRTAPRHRHGRHLRRRLPRRRRRPDDRIRSQPHRRQHPRRHHRHRHRRRSRRSIRRHPGPRRLPPRRDPFNPGSTKCGGVLLWQAEVYASKLPIPLDADDVASTTAFVHWR